MNASNSDQILRLFKCYVETVTDVMIEVADERLLQPKKWTLEQFLEDHLHLFYHQVGTFQTKTCDCPIVGCSLSKRIHKIDQRVFNSLYNATGKTKPGHNTKEQICICKFLPQNITLDDLDVSTLCFLLTTTAPLSTKETSSVKTIRNYRNDICHAWTKNHFTGQTISNIWADLESSLISLTCKRHTQRMIKREFQQHIQYVIGKDEVAEILEKMGKVVEEVNQLPSKSDFDNFRNCCLQQQNTIAETVCAKVHMESSNVQYKMAEHTDTLKEIQQKNTGKIMEAIENATFGITFPKRNLVPKDGVKLQGEGKVLWQFETPENWDVEGVEAILMDPSKTGELPFKIKLVKTGSLYLLTTVPASILENPATFNSAIRTFLSQIVEICKFDTSTSSHIEVVLSFLQESKDSTELGIEENIFRNQQKQAELGTKASVSSQTDLIAVECPHCYNTIELDNDVLDNQKGTRETFEAGQSFKRLQTDSVSPAELGGTIAPINQESLLPKPPSMPQFEEEMRKSNKKREREEKLKSYKALASRRKFKQALASRRKFKQVFEEEEEETLKKALASRRKFKQALASKRKFKQVFEEEEEETLKKALASRRKFKQALASKRKFKQVFEEEEATLQKDFDLRSLKEEKVVIPPETKHKYDTY